MDVSPWHPERWEADLPRLSASASALAASLRAGAARHPCCALAVTDGGRLRAVLRGRILHAGYCALDVHAEEGALDRALRALLAHLEAEFPGQRIEARILSEGAPPRLDDAFLAAGTELVLEQAQYARDLAGLAPAGTAPLTVTSYAREGKARLVEALARIFAGGPSGCVTDDPVDEVERMLFLSGAAGGAADTTLWHLAHLDGALAGAALAHVDRARRAGCLLYFGLVPGVRGRGLGHVLHRAALGWMAAAGATVYEDSTGVGNASMQRVLSRSGCVRTGTARHYVLRRPRDRGHVESFEALVAHLEAERYRCEILEPGVWLRAPMIFGGDEAVVDVGWARDARLVQVRHVFPFAVPPEHLARAALRAAALNATLNVPGFTAAEGPGGLAFRVPLFLDEQGRLPVHQLRRALTAVVHAAAAYRSEWRAALTPRASGVSLLARVPVLRSR